MNTPVIEHLAAAEPLRQWPEQFEATSDATFTVRMEAEEAAPVERAAFGLWRDREDLGDVDAYLHQPRRCC